MNNGDTPTEAKIEIIVRANGSVAMSTAGVRDVIQHCGILAVAMGMAQRTLAVPPGETPAVIPVVALPRGLRPT